MSSNINYEQIEEEIFKEQNELRKNPESYIEKLEKSLNYYQNNILSKENEIPIPTYEGIKAVKDAINFLKKQEPVPELIYSKEMSLSCKELVNDIGPKGLISHEGTETKNIYNRLEKYCDWDGAIAENLDFGFKIKYVGIGVGHHRDYGICVVIEYAYNIREKGTQYIDVEEFIKKNVKLNIDSENQNSNNDIEEENKRVINNPFQDGEPDAPDNTKSLRVEKEEKEIDGKIMKITKKIFTLDDDSQHIVEIEEPQEY